MPAAEDRFPIVIASLYAACATGLQYLTAVFSDALKSEVGLSQNDIETIGVATQCSGLLGVLTSMIWTPLS